MIYLLFVLSLISNGILVWYIRKLIKNYLFDIETTDKFNEMLEQYANSLTSLYKLEELYGDEIIKKAINQTKFVIDACKEFRGAFVETQEDSEAEEREEVGRETSTIRIKEGQKITQRAAEYKRIIIDN